MSPLNFLHIQISQIDLWLELQQAVSNLIDSSHAPPSSTLPPGIKQLLEKKQGLFRKHMMGKRVNYAARSVISPDPYIETNEIGVKQNLSKKTNGFYNSLTDICPSHEQLPEYFSLRLTYPEPVTEHNFAQVFY